MRGGLFRVCPAATDPSFTSPSHLVQRQVGCRLRGQRSRVGGLGTLTALSLHSGLVPHLPRDLVSFRPQGLCLLLRGHLTDLADRGRRLALLPACGLPASLAWPWCPSSLLGLGCRPRSWSEQVQPRRHPRASDPGRPPRAAWVLDSTRAPTAARAAGCGVRQLALHAPSCRGQLCWQEAAPVLAA